jgi:hypothetical protein
LVLSEKSALEGLPIKEARQHSWLFDVKGLVVTSRTDLQDFQLPFSHDHSAIAAFVEVFLLEPSYPEIQEICRAAGRQLFAKLAKTRGRRHPEPCQHGGEVDWIARDLLQVSTGDVLKLLNDECLEISPTLDFLVQSTGLEAILGV